MYLVVYKQLKPLENTTQMIKDISEGDGDLTGRLIIRSHDEIGKMSKYFNRFILQLHGIITKIKSIIKQEHSVKEELIESTGQVSSSLMQITSHVTGIYGQIKQLDENIIGSSTSVANNIETLRLLNQFISEQSAMVEESTAAIAEMIASVANVATITERKKESTDNLVAVTNRGGEKLDSFILVVHDVNQIINTIQEMSDVISEIASQTNMLSMNAAIEAAHAGDAGRGFAVVAEEIRKLAETSSSNSQNISLALKSISEKIESAYTSSEETRSSFNEINVEVQGVFQAFSEISGSSAELQAGGQQILSALSELQVVTNNVRVSSADMNRNNSVVDSSMSTLKDISGDVFTAIKEISGQSEEILLEMELVSKAVKGLESATESLVLEVNSFTT